ncbi:MAG: bifunctional transaldolase/phosoglucose isomerase [Chloroflexi bacterium]|nr:bifunctional transaldolase/phosoglucose isomerase [Chloroflexota bacterium]MCY4247410.1 bifunctional transaldolase/phosoglucose isomerase [Chloroflexota bacterium]
MSNPLLELQDFGQSAWLDYIHRDDLHNGALQSRIETDGVLGVTSNPAIFQKAIGDSDTYDSAIMTMLDMDTPDIYEALAIEDIQNATDLFRPLYERSGGGDGYVSLEVSPLLARDTQGTIAEAQRLFSTVDRPNLMIKIPATPQGLPAIEAAIAAGINVNVTLIFAINNYEQVAEAFIRGLERRLAAGEDVTRVASVASFFLSRIDVVVDHILENNIRAAQLRQDTARISANSRLLGQTAIANAKLAYRAFQRIFEGERFARLRAAGAQAQRPLWASTGTKNPAYSDTLYVDNLIGARTVNTLPPATLAAFKDHGRAADTLTKDMPGFLPPDEVLDRLAELGVDLAQVTTRLQDDGVDAFIDAFEKLISQVAAKRTLLRSGIIERTKLALGIYHGAVDETVDHLDEQLANARLWNKDGSLWKTHAPTIDKIVKRLGWLDIATTIDRERLTALQESVRGGHWRHVVLLGMGGSSLAPEVLARTFGRQDGFPQLIVLDSTDPARISQVEAAIELKKTLFVVASKSGGTIETLALHQYFQAKTGGAGEQFIIITDPGARLEEDARQAGARELFLNPADIGGRYSALSYFGMVPAALIGLDLNGLWERADTMLDAIGEGIPAHYHPGLLLGAVIGALALQGRDKITIYTSESLRSFGDWAEQLLAESLGKEGKGALPVVGAAIGLPHDYVTDRLFVYLRVDNDGDVAQMDAAVRTLREAGHPRVTLRLADPLAIAGEFLRWEYATAIAGALLRVNPFDEPNVTEAKDATKALLDTVRESGSLPQSEPVMTREPLQLYANENTLAPLRELCRQHGFDGGDVVQVIGAQMAGTKAGDYFALLVYFTPTVEEARMLEQVQRRLRHVTKRAVTIGYGPRYLHSTGQYHKGGGDNGVFWQLTADAAPDLSIPGFDYSFGALFAAQAAGDLQALQDHGRRAIRLHLSGDRASGLDTLLSAIEFVATRRR